MAIGYVRVSTKGQEDKYGIEAQKDAIEKYANENGYEITEYVVDVISGVKDERPGFNRLLCGDIKTDAVIVFKSDRVARETKLYFYYLYTLEKQGIKLLSVCEEFEEGSAIASIYRAIILFVAEQERENIRIRTMAGKEKKKAEKGYVGGRPPIGYFAAGGKLYAEPREKKVVRAIFEWYAEGYGCNLIAGFCNTGGFKTKVGKFYPMAISRILTHRKFYEGYIKEQESGEWVKGTHEAILGEDEFLRAEEE